MAPQWSCWSSKGIVTAPCASTITMDCGIRIWRESTEPPLVSTISSLRDNPFQWWRQGWKTRYSVWMLRAGIVGLPNVGKSTLFNAVTRNRKAEAANYPFCTIEPNVGMVTVPDARLEILRKIAGTNVVIPAAIEFV